MFLAQSFYENQDSHVTEKGNHMFWFTFSSHCHMILYSSDKMLLMNRMCWNLFPKMGKKWNTKSILRLKICINKNTTVQYKLMSFLFFYNLIFHKDTSGSKNWFCFPVKQVWREIKWNKKKKTTNPHLDDVRNLFKMLLYQELKGNYFFREPRKRYFFSINKILAFQSLNSFFCK